MPLLALLCFLLAPARALPPEVEVLTQRGDVVWGFDFLPGGAILLTERGGSLVLFDPKTRQAQEVPGAPKVWAHGQGGLLDVKLHPDFAKNHWVYLTYSEPQGKGAATALGRGRLNGAVLEGFEKLFTAKQGNSNGEHFGSRLVFDGPFLFMSAGERGERDAAQDLSRHQGKILRLTHDGKPAPGNPFAAKKDALPEIWSWGHRNPQGLALRPGTSELWSCEFGPRGGDELNLVLPGKNYGWPIVTYGREYYGPKIGVKEKEGFEPPVAHWVPSISPSGMAFHKGDIYLANLSGQHLRRLTLEGRTVTAQEKLYSDLGWRFRSVREGPDGLLYFSTDEGRLGRLRPR